MNEFKPVIFCDIETRTQNIHLDELHLYAYTDEFEEAVDQIADLVTDHYQAFVNSSKFTIKKINFPTSTFSLIVKTEMK